MSTTDRIMHALGWQRVDADQRPETPILTELTRCTDTHAAYLAHLEQAVEMAKAAALLDDHTLYALLHLAALKQMSPAVESDLHAVGIDTTPWATLLAEQSESHTPTP
ncbi:hypothetical protein [Isoptericola sp. NPDC055881]